MHANFFSENAIFLNSFRLSVACNSVSQSDLVVVSPFEAFLVIVNEIGLWEVDVKLYSLVRAHWVQKHAFELTLLQRYLDGARNENKTQEYDRGLCFHLNLWKM